MDRYDVVVCGGGSAGYGAAVTAGKAGLKTILIEQNGEIGGILTSGCLGYVMDTKGKSGIINEISALAKVKDDNGNNFSFDVEEMKYYLENSLVNAGVEIMYHTMITNVKKEDNKIIGVYVNSKSGDQLIEGEIFVDCTGDGDVGYLAGCSYEFGLNGKCQPMSFIAIISGLDYKEADKFLMNNPEIYCEDAKENLYNEFKKAGFEPSYRKCSIGHIRDDLYLLAINHQYDVKGINEKDVTSATINGRKEVFTGVEALRSLGGVWKDIKIVQTPSYIGVREGRRLKGKYTITKDDLINGTVHEDAICKVSFNVDIHTENGYEDNGIKTKPYDIPLRALLSYDIDNLMMAGRCISGDFYAHASYRVTGNTFVMGEQIGKYCALKLKK